MSFSYDTKNELCRLPVQKLCCARAEAYGILLYCNTFSASEVRIITGNPALAARIPKLFHRAFGLRFDRLPEEGESGKLVFQITDGGKLRRIVDLLGFSPEQNLALHINFGLLEEECCRASFLRGVFFAGGSVTDPAKRYHLELATSHLQVSRELEVLLRECGYPPKSVARNGSFITYFKQSDQIEDFLTLIGAPVAAMNIMSAKLEKDLRNSVNRRLNCDSANLDKAVDAALEQIDAMDSWEGSQLNQAKEILAFELTKMVHGEEEAKKAQEGARALFGAGANTANMPTTQLTDGDFTDGQIAVLDLLVKTGLAASKGEGRRLIQQGGLTVKDEKVTDPNAAFVKTDFEQGLVIKKGKKVFHKAVL